MSNELDRDAAVDSPTVEGNDSGTRATSVEGVDGPSSSSASYPTAFGRYQVERVLGDGAFGTVFLAQDPELCRKVAIKAPKSTRISPAMYAEEARKVAALSHPRIVPVHDVGLQDGQCFVVSEYVPGGSLESWLSNHSPTWTDAARIVAGVAEALAHAHAKGIIHRDVKPANILLEDKGEPKLADFGIALREGTDWTGHHIAGTPAYMSPEQATGRSDLVDGRSDIFSLGIVLYEMLTGRLPFQSSSSQQLLHQIANKDAKPPRQVNPDIPSELERICLKALARRPQDRYTTAADLAADLRRWQEEPVAPPPPSAPANPTVSHRHRLGYLLAASVFIGVPLGIVGLNLKSGFKAADVGPAFPATVQVESFQVVHYARGPDGAAASVRALPDGRPIRVPFGDSVRVEATFREPAYAFLFTLDADGKAERRFPKSLTEPTERVTEFHYPSSPTAVYTLNDGEGLQGILLVAAREWPANVEAWSEQVQAAWTQLPAQGDGWFFDGAKFSPETSRVRGEEEELRHLPAPFAKACQALAGPGLSIRALGFPVVMESPAPQ